MGGSHSRKSVLSQEQLEEYAQLTYLTKAEVMYIQRKFESLLPRDSDLLSYRHAIDDVCREFPELNYNPFRDQIFDTFSSARDGRLSFEDFVDLSSAMSTNCPLRVKASWAFRVFATQKITTKTPDKTTITTRTYDFDDDNQITRSDLCAIIDRLTLKPELSETDKLHIANVLLQEMDLQHTGGIGQMEFVHAIAKMPEFATTFSFRL